jgi:spermidine/putrescine-binding protein
VNSSDPGELRRAQAEAIRQKPLLRAYLNAEVRDQLVSGDVLAAHMWNTTAQQAMDSSPDIGFAYPEEVPDVVARGEWAKTTEPAAQRLRDRLWTEIKSA